MAVSQNARQTTEQPQKSTASFWDSPYVGIVFCIFVIACVVIYIGYDISLRQRLTEANTGTVVRVEMRAGNMLITHHVNDERYTGWLLGIPRGRLFVWEGAQIQIFYDPANPSQIRTNDISVGNLASWIVLIVLAPIVMIDMISKIKKPREEEAEEAPILTEEALEQDRKYRLRYTVKVGLAGFIIAMLSFLFLGAP